MSATTLRRDFGVIIKCDGGDTHDCATKFQTAVVVVRFNRAAAKKEGWGRGLRKGRKRRDHCPPCMEIERQRLKLEQTDAALRKAERDAKRKAKLSAPPLPKKPRKPKAQPVAAEASAPA